MMAQRQQPTTTMSDTGLEDGNKDDDSLDSINPEELYEDPIPPPSNKHGKGATILDADNGFNYLNRLAMLWTVRF